MNVCLHHLKPFGEIKMHNNKEVFEAGLKCTLCESQQRVQHVKDLDEMNKYMKEHV